MKVTLTLAAALLGLANAANTEDLEGVISSALSSAALSEGEEFFSGAEATDCVAVCAAKKNFMGCRLKYYGINNALDGCCCSWLSQDNSIQDNPKKECLSIDCPRDYPGSNPNPEGASSRVKGVLEDIELAPLYTGTKSCSQRSCMGKGTVNLPHQRKSNDFGTCYRIFWRGTGAACLNNCDSLFSSLIGAQRWGSKVYYGCMLGCEYGEREVTWREAIGKSTGIWTPTEQKNQKLQRFRESENPTNRLVAQSQQYRDELKDYDCVTQCRMTVWNKADKNIRCNWNKGLDLNVPELFDFDVLPSCEFGCRLAMDPTAGAPPFKYDKDGIVPR